MKLLIAWLRSITAYLFLCGYVAVLGPPSLLVAYLTGWVRHLYVLGRWGAMTGLLASNVLFGLAHSITPTYAVLAGLLGIYLGFIFTITGEENLIAPILCHSLYDLIAFLVVRRSCSACGRI